MTHRRSGCQVSYWCPVTASNLFARNRTLLIDVSRAQGFHIKRLHCSTGTIMKYQPTTVPRLIAVALAAVAGLAISSAAYAATSSPAAPAAAAIPQCAAAFGQDGNVGAWVPANEGDGAAGTVYYPLEFTNISGHTCSLFGYPGVSAVSSTGQQLGRPAGWGSLSGARRVVLAPGATAHTILAIHNVYSFTKRVCDPVHAVGLRIYLPDQRLATSVAFSFEACSRTGIVYMGVDPILAGAGTING
jgi:hypothetical protein